MYVKLCTGAQNYIPDEFYGPHFSVHIVTAVTNLSESPKEARSCIHRDWKPGHYVLKCQMVLIITNQFSQGLLVFGSLQSP